MLMRGRRLPGWSEGVGTTMAEEQTSMEEAKVTTAWAEMLRRSGTRAAQLTSRILMC